MGHSERNRDLVLSLVRRCSDALAAAVAPYAQKEVEPLNYDFMCLSLQRQSPLSSTLRRRCEYDGRGVEIRVVVKRHKSVCVDVFETSDVEDIERESN